MPEALTDWLPSRLPRHVEFDHLQARDRRQDRLHAIDHSRINRSFIERHALVDRKPEQRLQFVKPACHILHERYDRQRCVTLRPLVCWHRDFTELDLASRAPGQDVICSNLHQLVDGRICKAPGTLSVTGAKLSEAAAIGGAPDNRIIDMETIQHVQAKKSDVRCL